MATRRLLSELIARFEAASPQPVALESVGGVDAAARVRSGEVVDVVVLASDAIDRLVADGALTAGSRVDLVRSPVAAAIRAGAPRPDISSADAVRQAVLAARTVGYSTGPSGTHLAKLFAAWDESGALQQRTVVAPPGVPVGSLVARGEVELGFQQLSELMTLEGIDVVGLLPPGVQVTTVFSGGVARSSPQPDAARALLTFLASPELADVKQRHGMDAPEAP
jgi:molybdate transport system substrate-binding protein